MSIAEENSHLSVNPIQTPATMGRRGIKPVLSLPSGGVLECPGQEAFSTQGGIRAVRIDDPKTLDRFSDEVLSS